MGCVWAARTFGCCKLLKSKERETGIEPATSSLGKWTTIESKEQSGLWHAFLAQEIAAVCRFRIRSPLNGIQMGYTFQSFPSQGDGSKVPQELSRGTLV
jgi:hypothetical protein